MYVYSCDDYLSSSECWRFQLNSSSTVHTSQQLLLQCWSCFWLFLLLVVMLPVGLVVAALKFCNFPKQVQKTEQQLSHLQRSPLATVFLVAVILLCCLVCAQTNSVISVAESTAKGGNVRNLQFYQLTYIHTYTYMSTNNLKKNCLVRTYVQYVCIFMAYSNLKNLFKKIY